MTDIAGFLRDPQAQQDLKEGFKQAGAGALRGISADLFGMPVDLMTQPLAPRSSGNPYANAIRNLFGQGDTPVMSSDWIAGKLGMKDPGTPAYGAGRLLGGVLPIPRGNIAPVLKEMGPLAKEAGIFAGGGAKQAPMDKLMHAYQGHVAGEDVPTQWANYGAFVDPLDKVTRWEIGDEAMTFKPRWLYTKKSSKLTPIEDVIDHPQLFANYPQLGDYKIVMESLGPGVLGDVDHTNKIIRLNNDKTHAGLLRDVVLHELQHAVQFEEGMARGANVDMFPEDVRKQLEAEFLASQKPALDLLGRRILELESHPVYQTALRKKMQRDAAQGAAVKDPTYAGVGVHFTDEEAAALDQMAQYRKDLANKTGMVTVPWKDAFQAYEHVAGEVEARLVALRGRMTPEERAALSPFTQMGMTDFIHGHFALPRGPFPPETRIYVGPEGMKVGERP